MRSLLKAKVKLDYLVGTMIELPRAALLADQIAEVAEFFSFGTNDLTQTTMGLSRDDAGRFLPEYVDERKAGIFTDDPFQSLDMAGVGMLVEWGIAAGAQTRPDLKIGICGEHGGDAAEREVLPSRGDGLRERVAIPRADRAPGRGAGCDRGEEGDESEALRMLHGVGVPLRPAHSESAVLPSQNHSGQAG